MKQSERKLANADMEKVVELARADGCRIYTFESDSTTIEQIFLEDAAGRVGTVQSYYSGIKFSTVHKSTNHQGAGYGDLIRGEDFNHPEDYKMCFSTHPYWVRNAPPVYKYTSFADYLAKGMGILKYYEL